MERIRFILAIIVGKTVFFLTRILNRGGGTAAPGLIANKLYPLLVPRITNQLQYGSVVVTGTNGKTTTSRILSSILHQARYKPIHNRAGSNLMRGIASTLVEKCTLNGKIQANIGIWEIDEATLPYAVKDLNPKIVVITNLFRDQLDRYGSLENVIKIWQRALKKLPKNAKIVLCGDDPLLSSLGDKFKKVFFTGLKDTSQSLKILPRRACPVCHQPLSYSTVFYSHLGHYFCKSCGFSNPENDVFCAKIVFMKPKNTQILAKVAKESLNLKFNLTGLSNVYNVLSATAAAYLLNIPKEKIEVGVSRFKPAFSRFESFNFQDKNIVFLLAKNPAGFNEALRTVLRNKKAKNLLIAVNNLIADGVDTSWLGEVNFSMLKSQIQNFIVSGTKAQEVAKNIKESQAKGKITIEKDFQKAVNESIKKTKRGDTLFILPNYTAMLSIRKVLKQMGLIKNLWE